MTIRITHVRYSGTTLTHQAIERFHSVEDATGKAFDQTKPTMVDWLDIQGVLAYVASGGTRVDVGVVHDNPPYLRTHANGTPTDNLLSLPTY